MYTQAPPPLTSQNPEAQTVMDEWSGKHTTHRTLIVTDGVFCVRTLVLLLDDAALALIVDEGAALGAALATEEAHVGGGGAFVADARAGAGAAEDGSEDGEDGGEEEAEPGGPGEAEGVLAERGVDAGAAEGVTGLDEFGAGDC
jgi:hypothetical protein